VLVDKNVDRSLDLSTPGAQVVVLSARLSEAERQFVQYRR
jgi:hypothetical protein